jgi:hypothetical protein
MHWASMTKQHYEFIADVLANLDILCDETHEYVIKEFADALQATNSQFNREQFIAACLVMRSLAKLVERHTD